MLSYRLATRAAGCRAQDNQHCEGSRRCVVSHSSAGLSPYANRRQTERKRARSICRGAKEEGDSQSFTSSCSGRAMLLRNSSTYAFPSSMSFIRLSAFRLSTSWRYFLRSMIGWDIVLIPTHPRSRHSRGTRLAAEPSTPRAHRFPYGHPCAFPSRADTKKGEATLVGSLPLDVTALWPSSALS